MLTWFLKRIVTLGAKIRAPCGRHHWKEKLDHLHFWGFFGNTNVNITWSNHQHQHNTRSSSLTTPHDQTTYLQSESDGGRLCFSLEIIDYATFVFIVQLITRRTLCWGVPYINPIRNKFPSLFEDVVWGSLKPFLPSDHQVGISLHLTEAATLCHSRKLACFKPWSWCSFCPISLLASWTLKTTSFHWHRQLWKEI